MAKPLLPLVDRIFKGRLADTLTGWRAEGLSHEQIARRLHHEHDIDVTAETVRGWCEDFGIPTNRKAAS